MSNITLDLSNEERFETNTFTIDKNITFIFGKNGTGKTTLTNLLKDNATDYEVSVFQGFETVVSESNMLDAVILGKDNVEIDKKIAEKNAEIEKIKSDVERIEKNISEQPDDPNNLWARYEEKKTEYNNQKDKLDKFFRTAASKIKKENDPTIADTNYDKNCFEKEISIATEQSEDTINILKKTLNVEEKHAKKLPLWDLNLAICLSELNKLLCRKVIAKDVFEEFSGNKRKEEFAKMGVGIHEAGELCAFCGNELSRERLEKLRLYFSADEVEGFRKDIQEFIDGIDEVLKKLRIFDVEVTSFYPDKIGEAKDISRCLSEQRNEIEIFLNELRTNADNKLKYLYETLDSLKVQIPPSLEAIINKHNGLVEKNNSSVLSEKKEEARNKLRLHKVKLCLEEFNFATENTKCEVFKKIFSEIGCDLQRERERINVHQSDIKVLEDEIKELVRSTKNEKILADEINRKLKLYVNFELVHMQDKDEKGFYQIKCRRTGDIRNVDELSTGEKNIIAFLYFLEKLKEVKAGNSKPKLIIFDDPMNSNDDTMQYVIIEELQKLMRRVKGENKFILLTHNNHFYLNVKYGFDRDESYGKNTFMRFNYNGHNIEFKPIQTKNEDFKTNYDAFWKELEFLYDSQDASAAMLLNPCRRITETFIKFNCLKLEGMLGMVTGAQKMFNVNSHSIDDLEADLNGMEKMDIIKMLQECFKGVNAEEHFENHCKIKIV